MGNYLKLLFVFSIWFERYFIILNISDYHDTIYKKIYINFQFGSDI